MIEFVRARKKGVVNFILLGLTVILMASFGLQSFAPGSGDTTAAITINGEEISRREFEQKLRSIEDLYSRQFQGAFDQIKGSLNLPQKIADQMIEERLLTEYIDELGLTASLPQIEARIAQIPFFGGTIDKKSFQSYLEMAGISEASLERSIKKEVVEQALSTAFTQLAAPSEAELQAIYAVQGREARFLAARFSSGSLEKGVTITDEEIAKYYEEHKLEYIKPKQIDLEYVTLSAEKFQAKVPVQDGDLRQLYEERRSQLRESEKVKVQKISFKKEAEQSEAEEKKNEQSTLSLNDKKRQLAQTVIERTKRGDNFAALSAELSEDTETKTKGGELGWKNITDFNDDIQAGFDGVSAGTTTGIVEDANEIAVYFISERTPEREIPFEDVREKLAAELRAADAPMYLDLESEKLYSQLQSSDSSLEQLGKAQDLPYKTIGGVSADASGVPAKLITEALHADIGVLGRVSAGNAVYFFKVQKITPEAPKSLAEASEQIRARLKREKATTEARNRADRLVKDSSLTSPAALEKVAAEAGAELIKTELKTAEALDAEFATSPNEVAELYALTSSQPLLSKSLSKGGAFYVIMLAEKREADPAEFAKKRGELLVTEAKQAGARLLDSLVANLKSQSKIEVNPEILQNAEG